MVLEKFPPWTMPQTAPTDCNMVVVIRREGNLIVALSGTQGEPWEQWESMVLRQTFWMFEWFIL